MRHFALSFFLAASFATSQVPTPPGSPVVPPPKPQQAWTEHYRKATVSFGVIQTIGGRETFQVIGTGVVVAPDNHHPYFVTAKHVFFEPVQGWHPAQLRVRFSVQEKKSFSEELGVPLVLTDPTGKNRWSALDDGSDIAAIPVQQAFAGLLTDAVGYADFASNDEVFDGATVFVFGFPGDSSALIGPNGLVRAVTRSGIIAWTDPNGALENPLLLDSNILPGNSGGPAFKVPSGLDKFGGFAIGGRVAFLGVVTEDLQGYYTVQGDGRILQMQYPDLPHPSIEQVKVVGIGGMGKVEPASKIKKLIDSILSAY
jgi:hypothetical protein